MPSSNAKPSSMAMCAFFVFCLSFVIWSVLLFFSVYSPLCLLLFSSFFPFLLLLSFLFFVLSPLLLVYMFFPLLFLLPFLFPVGAYVYFTCFSDVAWG